MDFEKFKQKVLANATRAHACVGEYRRAYSANTIEELIEVIADNIAFVRNNDIVTDEMIEEYGVAHLFYTGNNNGKTWFNSGDLNSGYLNSGYRNSGDRNSGDLNSGDLNSGDRNSGDRNSGDRNSGYRNSGDRNSGYLNSGDLNSGDLNSGDLNSGYRNSGDRNSGYRNSGYRNSGDLNSGYLNSGYRNSGDRNSGYRNSGDLNSGYRNSGIFCNRKKTDTVMMFNRDSDMTWDAWSYHPVNLLTRDLEITRWIDWAKMTDEERAEQPNAYVCGGYVKVFTYHEAWRNLWDSLTPSQRKLFEELPNFDAEVFKDITGIDYYE